MQEISRKLCLTLLFILVYCHCISQINLATLDTTKWLLDTLTGKTLVISPKFEFTADTSIYFYQIIKQKKQKVLTLTYNQKSRYIHGAFKGTKRYINSNNYLHLNLVNTKLDYAVLMSMTDTIINMDDGKDFCIRLSNLGIRDSMLMKRFGHCCFNYNEELLIIARQRKDETFPMNCFYEAVLIEEQEPPYLQSEACSNKVIER